jgi:hypothetical protein
MFRAPLYRFVHGMGTSNRSNGSNRFYTATLPPVLNQVFPCRAFSKALFDLQSKDKAYCTVGAHKKKGPIRTPKRRGTGHASVECHSLTDAVNSGMVREMVPARLSVLATLQLAQRSAGYARVRGPAEPQDGKGIGKRPPVSVALRFNDEASCREACEFWVRTECGSRTNRTARCGNGPSMSRLLRQTAATVPPE